MMLVIRAKTATAMRALAWNNAGILVGVTVLSLWEVNVLTIMLTVDVTRVRRTMLIFNPWPGAFKVPRVVNNLCPLRMIRVKNSVMISVVMVSVAQTTVLRAEPRRLMLGTVRLALLVSSIARLLTLVRIRLVAMLALAIIVIVPMLLVMLANLGWILPCTVC